MKIFYDGDCYFCSNYVELIKLKSKVGDVQLISLRSNHPDLVDIKKNEFKINTGFVVKYNEKFYEGSNAFSLLNSLLEENSLKIHFLKFISSSTVKSYFFYKILVFGRFLTLLFQGLPLINLKETKTNKNYRLIEKSIRISLLFLSLIFFTCILMSVIKQTYIYVFLSFTMFSIFVFGLTLSLFRSNIFNLIIRNLIRGSFKFWIIYFFVFYLTINFTDFTLVRRFIGFFLVIPIICVFIYLGQNIEKKLKRKSLIFFLPALILIFASIPGLHIGPFYGGISGWIIPAKKIEPITMQGFKLINENGEKTWFNHAHFQPHGMQYRFYDAYMWYSDKDDSKFVNFAYKTYQRNFELISKGKYPHQWLLGKYAYPTHTMSYDDTEKLTKNFHPSKIIAIEKVVDIYSFDKKFIKSEILATYDLKEYKKQLKEQKKDKVNHIISLIIESLKR